MLFLTILTVASEFAIPNFKEESNTIKWVLPEGNTDSNLVINPDFGGKMESLEHRALNNFGAKSGDYRPKNK
jgi:hypothetical protein